jgi:hypothetical protein
MTTTNNKNLNIAHLIEKNSMTRLSKDYENKFLMRIKENFNENQQQLFVASFYCFLNYDKKKDFVIDFDNVWKWMGYTRKSDGKRVLEKFFTKEVDYQVIKAAAEIGGAAFETVDEPAPEVAGAGQNLGGAGLNKETIMLSVNTFKKFCLKAGTKKADEVHDYYIKLEELLQETLNEESNELRLQLGNEKNEKQKIVEEKKKVEDKLDKIVRATTARKQLSEGEIIYVGLNELDPTAFKVGITSKPNTRAGSLSGGTTTDFDMKHIWYTRFNKEIEDAVKKNYVDHRILQRKEFYNIGEYDTIVSYIEKLVNIFNETDRFKQEIVEPTKKKQVKNPLKLPEKPCTVCHEVKSLEDFHFAKEHTDGRENRCKVCVTRLQEEHIQKKRETEAIPIEKECTHCKEVFTLDHFYVDAQKFDGRGTKCKGCIKKVQTRDNKPKIDVTEYNCLKCRETKPLEEFHKLKRTKTGHKYKCKKCELSEAKERYHRKKGEEVPEIMN